MVADDRPSLIGRDWLAHLRLDWASIRHIATSEASSEVQKLTEKYSQVFQAGPGIMKQLRAHLTLKPEAKPKYFCPRPVPYAIKERVGQELNRLEETGVLRKVKHSEWAAPIVPCSKTRWVN